MNRLILTPTILIVTLTLSSAIHAQEPANPVQFDLFCNIPWGQSTCSAQVSLPPGKRIVLETVSASAYAPPGQQIQLYVSTTSETLPKGSIAARHYVVLTPTNGGVMTYYFANHRLRMYGQTGSAVSIHGQRAFLPGYPGVVGYDVWFSGYLLP